MLTFCRESFSYVKDEILPLLQEHAEALSPHKGKYPLRVNAEVYQKLENCGLLHIMVARAEGKIVGYCSFVKCASLHYAGVINFDADAFYLKPAYRKGSAGYRLLKEAHKMCKEAGATHIVQRCKIHADLTKLFERMGFKKIEYTFLKEV